MSITLAKNGITTLLQTENSINEDILVQVINLKPLQQVNYYSCHISDGYLKIKSALSTSNSKFSPQQHNFAIIRVKKHTIIRVNEMLRGIQIQDFDIEGPYPELIGDPVNYSPNAQISQLATNFIDIDKMKAKNAKKKPIEVLKEQSEKKQPIYLTLDDSQIDITERRLKDSDKISDLYVDLPNWQIICRITDKNYKEFISKKNNKFTQILTIELMDRTGMKIQGTAFGQYAKQLSLILNVNGLYRVSRGQIKQENYSANKGSKYSRFNIYFTKSTVFQQLKDTSLVPKFNEDGYYSVQQVIEQKDFEKQYDVAAILTQYGQEKQIMDKNGKPLVKRVISVSDPENNQTIQVTLWRDIKFEEGWKGKTILLKNFKLNSYMNNISLNSHFKSEIKPLENHRYKSLEGNLQTQKFTQVSSVPSADYNDDCRTIKHLQNDISYMAVNQTIHSNLNAYVSLMSFKSKWFYESCPKCKKGGAQSNTTCLHCSTLIDEPISRFILPIQIADFTGSLWTTSFDEFSHVLLQGKDINELKKYDQIRLRQEGEKRIFRQFRFKISTKKEANGSVKHTILGKPQEIAPEKNAVENIHRIYQYE